MKNDNLNGNGNEITGKTDLLLFLRMWKSSYTSLFYVKTCSLFLCLSHNIK